VPISRKQSTVSADERDKGHHLPDGQTCKLGNHPVVSTVNGELATDACVRVTKQVPIARRKFSHQPVGVGLRAVTKLDTKQNSVHWRRSARLHLFGDPLDNYINCTDRASQYTF
jgi:hypothetical protein